MQYLMIFDPDEYERLSGKETDDAIKQLDENGVTRSEIRNRLGVNGERIVDVLGKTR